MAFDFQNKTVTVQFADAQFAGYGHQKIKVVLEFEGETETFSATTNFMPGYDAANDLDGQDRYDAFYDLISSQIDEAVLEWLLSITPTFTNTQKVTCSRSLSTEKMIVKVSRVAYGHINNGVLFLNRNATESVMHSLSVFAEKNNLAIKTHS